MSTNYVFLGNYDNNGVSSLLNYDHEGSANNTDLKKTISSALLVDVNDKLPERVRLPQTHPEWIRSSDYHFIADGTFKFTFIDEGAGYRNVVGYFIYDTDTPPAKASEISEIVVVFPNASKQGGGGTLVAGDTVQFPYEYTVSVDGTTGRQIATPTNYIFPDGKSIGMVLIANGWNTSSKTIRTGNRHVYSRNTYNVEVFPENRYHMVNILSDIDPSLVIVGFEDLNRDSGSDDDFNDAVFIAEITPLSSMKPTVINKTSTTYANGTILLEDETDPTKFNNNDYNDFVGEYEVNEVLIDEKLSTIDMVVHIKHRGSMHDHAFGIHLPGIQNTSCTILRQAYIGDTAETATAQVITPDSNGRIELVNSTRTYMPPNASRYHSCNVHDDWETDAVPASSIRVKITFDSPVTRASLGNHPPPYNPYFKVYRWSPSNNRRNPNYTLIESGVKYPGVSIEFTRIGVTDVEKIQVLHDYIDYRVPKEHRGIFRPYPRFIDHIRNNKRRYAYWLEDRDYSFTINYYDVKNLARVWTGF